MATQARTLSSSTFVNTLMIKTIKTMPVYLNASKPLWNLYGDGVQQFKMTGENYVEIPFQTQFNEGAGIPSYEGATYPTGVKMEFSKSKIYIKKFMSRGDFNVEMIDLTAGEYAIVKGVPRLIDSTMKAFAANLDTYFHGDASGVLCQATGAPAGQVVTMDSVRFLRPGMMLDGYHSTSKDADSVQIESINRSTKAVTFTAASTVSSVNSDTQFMHEDVYVTSPTIETGKIIQGIETIINDTDPIYGDFQNMDRGTLTYAQALVKTGAVAGTAEAITRQRMISTLDMSEQYHDELPDFGYCDRGVYNSIYQSYIDSHQPTIFMPAKDGIPKTLVFDYGDKTIRIFPSWKALPNTLFFINKKHIFKYVLKDFVWDTEGGMYKPSTTVDARWFVGRMYINFFTDMPQSNYRLEDITETV